MTLDATFLEQTLTAGTATLLQSTSDILFSSPLTSSGSGVLTVNAGGNATFNADLNLGSGSLGVVTTTGDVNIGSDVTMQTSSFGTLNLRTLENGSDITLGNNSQLQSQNSTLALSTSTGLEASGGSVTVQTPETGESIVIDTDITLDPTFLGDILTAGTAVLLESNSNILLSNPISSSGSGALTLNSVGAITLDADLNGGSGSLAILAGGGDLTTADNITLQTSGLGTITLSSQNGNLIFGSNFQVQTQGGTFQLLPSTGLAAMAESVSVQAGVTGSVVIGADMVVDPTFLGQLLNSGTAAMLQSNTDIFLSSPISSLGTGALTLSAAGNVMLAADLDLGSGLLAALAAAGDLTVGSNVTVQTSDVGAITLTAQASNIIFGANSQMQTEHGNLQLSAALNISAINPVTLQTVGVGELILICDALFPTSPGFGDGLANFPEAVFNTGGGKLLIYTSQRALNTLPTSINNVLFVQGPEFVNSITEKWGVYYPNSSGFPFTVFYKNTGSPPPPPPGPPPAPPGPPPAPPGPTPSPAQHFFVNAKDAHAAILAAVEPFHFWMNPWYSDTFFATNIYPPYLTPTIKRQVLPSLIQHGDNLSNAYKISQNKISR